MVWILAGLWLLFTIAIASLLGLHERRINNLETAALHLIRRAHAEDARLRKFLSIKATPGKA